MSEVLTQARLLLEKRKAEVDRESKQLTAALEALKESGEQPATRGQSRVATRSRVKPGERQAQFVEFLRKNPDSSVGAVARGLGISAAQASTIAARLSRAGRINKRGRALRVS